MAVSARRYPVSKYSAGFPTRMMERLHGDRRQRRESMVEYSSSCIDMSTDKVLISADSDVNRPSRYGVVETDHAVRRDVGWPSQQPVCRADRRPGEWRYVACEGPGLAADESGC